MQEIVNAADERAAALRLPLEWPERWPMAVPAAMRVAHYAAQQGRGGAFVLAATRLAFAGGFDLDDLEILTEAAAAAGLQLDGALRAAREERRDGAMEAAARRLLGAGADRLPALWVARGVFWGEDRVGDAAATARMHAAMPRSRGALRRRASTRPRRSLGRDETGEDLLVERLAVRGLLAREAQDRIVAVGLGEQQLEIGVGDLGLRFRHRGRSSFAPPATLNARASCGQSVTGGATPRPGGIDSRRDG